MTRLIVDDPGPAHSAKNATGPGLPNQPARHSKGRLPMVGKARALFTATAAKCAARLGGERVSYTPQALNALIDAVASQAVAGRLRQHADWHVTRAEDALLPPYEREWHASESVELEHLAAAELARAGGEWR